MTKILLLTLFVSHLAFGLTSGLNAAKTVVSQRNQPKSCAEASNGKTGVYTIQIPYTDIGQFSVTCDSEYQNGNWLVIQRRVNGSVDFYRPWTEYKEGFGNVRGEFFIGLDKLHYLTEYHPHELLIVMEDFNGVTKYAKYADFAIGNEAESYHLKTLGAYSGTAGDSLKNNKAQKFSTYDRDNDLLDDTNCARDLAGAWWYKGCGMSNLNGLYLKGKYQAAHGCGADWYHFQNDYFYSLNFIQMMIRPLAIYNN